MAGTVNEKNSMEIEYTHKRKDDDCQIPPEMVEHIMKRFMHVE